MNPVPVEDYIRNLRAAIGAHRITREELDALVTAGPTICTAHGLPVAFGALVRGRPACAECVKGLRVPPDDRYDAVFYLHPDASQEAYYRTFAHAHARLAEHPEHKATWLEAAAFWEKEMRHATR